LKHLLLHAYNLLPEKAFLFTWKGEIDSGAAITLVINEAPLEIANIGATEEASVV
jgi:hypothetical protein